MKHLSDYADRIANGESLRTVAQEMGVIPTPWWVRLWRAVRG